MEKTTLLRVSGLEAGYGATTVLKGVDLEVNRGEIVALLGSNGAGKSTTLNAISGVIAAKAGSVEFNGRRLAGLHPSAVVRLGLGHCPEGRQLFPDLTVQENLRLGAYGRNRASAEIHKDLEGVFRLFPILKERTRQFAGTLSGGQQQMLAIGRALMGRPSLLLMDEPSLGLAPLIVTQLFQLIRRINEEGTTIFLVEQNAVASLKIAHRAYVMESGRIVMGGAAADVSGDARIRAAYLGVS